VPIVEVEVICQSEAEFAVLSAQSLADALGQVFGIAPGHTWVKLLLLSSHQYAESETVVQATELPVFVSILHAHLPQDELLAAEAKTITLAVAQCLGRAPDRVHVQYAPAAAGRQAFGGTVVR
jgi:hypothetical protein